jgi:hypothetical protein
MASIKVTSPFTVMLDPPKEDEKREFDAYTFPAAGEYDDVPEEAAAHWYTQMHVEGYEPAPRVKVLAPKPEVEHHDSRQEPTA